MNTELAQFKYVNDIVHPTQIRYVVQLIGTDVDWFLEPEEAAACALALSGDVRIVKQRCYNDEYLPVGYYILDRPLFQLQKIREDQKNLVAEIAKLQAQHQILAKRAGRLQRAINV